MYRAWTRRSRWCAWLFALAHQLYGGLKAVALTDAVQVGLLILDGLSVMHFSCWGFSQYI